MARFLGNAAGRTLGAATGTPGFTRARIFDTPGTASFQVPPDASKVKVFVVGAGSSYREGTYLFQSANCCSGVDYPSTCYCACFTGHLTGAGGGYAEKTFTQATDFIGGKTLTINVGSIGGLSASSVSGDSLPTVTATNATEAAYSWNCTNNVTARDNSNDNPISIGIELPVCGYRNEFSGYYNNGGTASGGDVNRTGGKGIIIPEFIEDSYFDGLTCNITTTGSTTNTSSCWINPTITFACGAQYHNQFGFNGQNFTSYLCSCLCGRISNLCTGAAAANRCASSRFSFIGNATKNSGSCSPLGSEKSIDGIDNRAANKFIKNVPIGVGAQSGTSSSNGKHGYSDLTIVESTFASTSGGSGGAPCTSINYSRYVGSYDFSFGGTRWSCTCEIYDPGCYSSNNCRFCGGQHSLCYVDTNQITYGGWTCQAYYIGHQFPYGLANTDSLGSGYRCSNRCYNLAFVNDQNINSPQDDYIINLSTFVDQNDSGIADVLYGRGAGISTSASFGGGGNRLYPSGGNGIVVLIY